MTTNTETFEHHAQATLENETVDVRHAVRQITLKAMSDGKLNTVTLTR